MRVALSSSVHFRRISLCNTRLNTCRPLKVGGDLDVEVFGLERVFEENGGETLRSDDLRGIPVEHGTKTEEIARVVLRFKTTQHRLGFIADVTRQTLAPFEPRRDVHGFDKSARTR